MAELITGFLIAFAVGLTGVGGGLLTTPALILIFRLGPAESVGTALLYASLIRLPAIAVFLRRGLFDCRLLLATAAIGLPAAALGAWMLARWLRGATFVPAMIGLVVIVAAGCAVLHPSAAGARRRPGLLALYALPIGLQTGFCSSGAGALGLVCLLRHGALDPPTAVGTNLMFATVLSLAAGGIHLAAGNWDPRLLSLLAVSGLVGAPLGALATPLLPTARLRTGLLLWVMLLGGGLVWKGVAP